MGPGSAEQRAEALHRARDTSFSKTIASQTEIEI
jgi:hypothetical protein